MASLHTPSLVDQASTILQAARDLQHKLDQVGLQQPSFEPNSGGDWHDASEHPDLLKARSALIDASQTMLNLALGPMDKLNH
jgi:hypothetical protein